MIWNVVFIIHVLHVYNILVRALSWSEDVVDVYKAGCGIGRSRVPSYLMMPCTPDQVHTSIECGQCEN